jgi:uncharacterized protein (TIGR00266 family)
MRYEIGYQPSYSLAIINLEPGEEVRCESGAMVSMSGDLVLEAKMNTKKEGGNFLGNAIGALTRTVLAKESFFITSVRATNTPGEVTLAPAVPGDITALELHGRNIIVQAGSYLASSNTLQIDTKWGGLKGFIGGEGLFFLRASGDGTLFLTSFGAIHKRELKPGEVYVVDTGHLVAYEEGVKFETAMASGSGGGGFIKRAMNSAVTGEGLVMKFTGPGTVWLQTRNPQAFGGWLQTLLPTPTNSSSAAGSALGAVTDLLGK